jgi:hypothetical protein
MMEVFWAEFERFEQEALEKKKKSSSLPQSISSNKTKQNKTFHPFLFCCETHSPSLLFSLPPKKKKTSTGLAPTPFLREN